MVALISACATGPERPHLERPITLDRAALQRQAHAVAETWLRDHPAEKLAWSWGEGVLAYGLWQLAQQSRDDALRSYLTRYLHARQADAVRIAWSDDTTPGLTAAELVLAGDSSLRPLLDRVVHYVMTAPRTEAQGLIRHLGRHVPPWLTPRSWFPDAWVDSLFHFTITLCRYSQIQADPRYREEAVTQLQRFLRNLQDPASGLVTHAYNDKPRDEQVPAFDKRAFWARGNGWALVSAVELWRASPADDPQRAAIAASARRLASALLRLQAADGLFHTVLMDPSTYEETAGSGLIVYAFALGARSGLFDARYRTAAAQGMLGLISKLEPNGDRLEVSGTSTGTNPSTSARRYAQISRKNQLSYGVGAWLLAATALLAD
jgi:unsaturated rhamnogalacturonyl hydrolase